MVVCTVAAVAVVPLTIDLYTPDRSADAPVDTQSSGATGAEVSAPGTGGLSDGADSTVIDKEPVHPELAAAATSVPEPDRASVVLETSFDPAPTEPLPDTVTGVPTPSVVVPLPVPLTPPAGSVAGPVDAWQVEAPSEGSTAELTDAAAVGEAAPTDSGVGSGMGGDLPPEVLPAPAYPQCPITEAGPWGTDPADPHTCIPPYPIQFHEPTPPGIPPELLEPIFEEPGAPVAPVTPAGPEGSVGWYEPTPPGIDPSLLEPIMESGVQPESGR